MNDVLEQTELVESTVLDSPWVTIVWNDPVNLMNYVSWVFRDRRPRGDGTARGGDARLRAMGHPRQGRRMKADE